MTPPQPHAVVIAAACYRDAEAAIGVSLAIARGARAQLVGLFAEEARDIAAGLLAGGSAPSEGAMRRAAENDAAAFRRRLEAAARAAALSCRFERASDRAERAARRIAGPGDIVIFARRPAAPPKGGAALIRAGADDDTGAPLAPLLREFGNRVETIDLDAMDEADGRAVAARLGRRAVSAVLVTARAAARLDLAELRASARAPVIVALPEAANGAT